MAKCSVHGTEIGTVYYATKAKRYMSDGVILLNIGFGWKRYGKVKTGHTPQDAYQVAQANQDQRLADRPALAAYIKLLHDMAGLSKRWKLHSAVQSMPDDCDGVWSEACDGYGDNVSASVDEVAELCRAFQAVETEIQTLRTQQV
jgi:hypothetical protein